MKCKDSKIEFGAFYRLKSNVRKNVLEINKRLNKAVGDRR
jgi:hypothetical protein